MAQAKAKNAQILKTDRGGPLRLALGVFDDVRTSVVVDWQGGNQPDAVTNEIDVMATCGVRPIFISCKTSGRFR